MLAPTQTIPEKRLTQRRGHPDNKMVILQHYQPRSRQTRCDVSTSTLTFRLKSLEMEIQSTKMESTGYFKRKNVQVL